MDDNIDPKFPPHDVDIVEWMQTVFNQWLAETFVFEYIDKDELTDKDLDIDDGEIDIVQTHAIWDADVADKGDNWGRLKHYVLDQLELWTAELHKALNKKYPSGGTGYHVRYGKFHRTPSQLGYQINCYIIKV